MSISTKGAAKGFQRMPPLKYNNVQKWESRFHFRAQHWQKHAIYKKNASK